MVQLQQGRLCPGATPFGSKERGVSLGVSSPSLGPQQESQQSGKLTCPFCMSWKVIDQSPKRKDKCSGEPGSLCKVGLLQTVLGGRVWIQMLCHDYWPWIIPQSLAKNACCAYLLLSNCFHLSALVALWPWSKALIACVSKCSKIHLCVLEKFSEGKKKIVKLFWQIYNDYRNKEMDWDWQIQLWINELRTRAVTTTTFFFFPHKWK